MCIPIFNHKHFSSTFQLRLQSLHPSSSTVHTAPFYPKMNNTALQEMKEGDSRTGRTRIRSGMHTANEEKMWQAGSATAVADEQN